MASYGSTFPETASEGNDSPATPLFQYGTEETNDALRADVGAASWRRPVLAATVAALAVSGLAYAGVSSVRQAAPAARDPTQMAKVGAKSTKHERPKFTARRNGYDKLSDHTLKAYAVWDMIIEPNCEMVFEIENYDSSNTYSWNITATPDSDVPDLGNEDFHPSQAHAEIQMIKQKDDVAMAKFKGVNVYYRISVTMYNTDHPEGLVRTLDAVTKYVRREIRTLTDSDRNKYLDALLTIYNTSQEEGQAKFGPAFVSHAHLTGMHNSADYIYHGNLFFLTSHPTMQLKVEKALAAVTPDVAMPYWDFMLDSHLGENWTQSILYSDEWFGPADTDKDDDYRVRGRFRYVEKEVDVDELKFPEAGHSPYGMLTWVTDFNKQHYLQRTNKVCDFAMTEPFAKCHEMSYCFSNYTTLYEFDMCLESNVHGNLHSMHAGLFDCEVSWQDWYEENTWVTKDRLSFFAVQMEKNMYDIQESLYVSYLSCPTRCDLELDTYETCRCTANSTYGWDTPEDIEKTTTADDRRNMLQDLYEVMYDTGPYGNLWIEVYESDMGQQMYMPKQGDEDSKHYMTTENIVKLELLLFQTVIFAGNQGVMASGASANDPLFWVFHQVFDKALQAMRLSPIYSHNNMTWNNVVQGAGDRWEKASVAEIEEGLYTTPFQAQIFEPSLGGKIDAGDYLTNKQLWALLKPDSNSLSYVYDDFTSWGGCDFDPFSANATKPY